jgi:hypothetical protein
MDNAALLEAPSLVPVFLTGTQAKTKGNKVNVGVKYAEKQERKFEPEKLREGRNIIGLQVRPLRHLLCSAFSIP